MSKVRYPALLVEYRVTRDAVIDEPNGGWTCRAVPPRGAGWRIADASSDRKTRWRRILLIDASSLVLGGGQP